MVSGTARPAPFLNQQNAQHRREIVWAKWAHDTHEQRQIEGTGELVHLSVWPSVDPILPADLLERGQTDAQGLCHGLLGHLEVL